MQDRPNVYKLAGFVVAIVGLWLFSGRNTTGMVTKPILGWWGFFGGIALICLGWGLYDMGRNVSRQQEKDK